MPHTIVTWTHYQAWEDETLVRTVRAKAAEFKEQGKTDDQPYRTEPAPNETNVHRMFYTQEGADEWIQYCQQFNPVRWQITSDSTWAPPGGQTYVPDPNIGI